MNVDDFPLLLSARQLGQLAGCSEAQINALRREGAIPDEVIHPSGYGGWRKYSKLQAIRWLNGELGAPPRSQKAAS